MRLIGKFLAFGVIATSTTLAAHALPIVVGSISANDNSSTFDNAAGTILFGASGSIDSAPPSTGGSTISPYFTNGAALTFYADTLPGSGGAFFYNPSTGGSVGPLPGATPTSGGVEVFSVTENGETLAFYTTYDFTYADAGTAAGGTQLLLLTGTGYFTETGVVTYATTAATFNLTGSETGGSFQFGGTAGANPAMTPEPNSLVLLGTGLLSSAGVVLRKRRSIA